MAIDYDIETYPLQILTDSVVGSGDQLRVVYLTEGSTGAGGIRVMLSDPPQYWIGGCTDWVDFTAPEEQFKVWTITVTETSVVLTCNGVEIVNYLFSESEKENCVSRGSKDTTKIVFKGTTDGTDTASDKFRGKPTGTYYLVC